MSARARLAGVALGAMLAALAVLAWHGYGRPEVLLWLGSSLFLCA
ncbi:MAG TPA: hypothetical protein VFN70_13810 [Burkholderiales bacterium]|nr:hypothetical protein [Burkholderiales bacterium]